MTTPPTSSADTGEIVINFVFGATVLGWIGALIWAMNKIDDPLKGGVKYDPQTHDPMV